ncbi:unnamed protein product, partial [Allacma fusca]
LKENSVNNPSDSTPAASNVQQPNDGQPISSKILPINVLDYLKQLDRKLEIMNARVKQIGLSLEVVIAKLNMMDEHDGRTNDSAIELPLPLKSQNDVNEFDDQMSR